ncbi:UNVERIFIED_CONTAM: hypothetical protein H355_008588, partial [Colinus virginianus]
KYSTCIPEMAKKDGRVSLNRLIWILKDSLNLLQPVQDKSSEKAVSGAASAYFPDNSSCLHTLAYSEPKQLNTFLEELAEQGIDTSNHDKEADCLICGY